MERVLEDLYSPFQGGVDGRKSGNTKPGSVKDINRDKLYVLPKLTRVVFPASMTRLRFHLLQGLPLGRLRGLEDPGVSLEDLPAGLAEWESRGNVQPADREKEIAAYLPEGFPDFLNETGRCSP